MEINKPNVNLLRTSRAESLSTLVTRKLISFCMRMSMVHELAAVRELLVTDFAHDTLVAMRRYVTLQASLVVKCLAALGARMVFLA